MVRRDGPFSAMLAPNGQADEGYSISVLAMQREAAELAIRVYLDGTSRGSTLAFA
ncbi:hypothetical protein SAMN04488125_11826 [Methylorubrum salsuginis]|uniref:Uncharacterized protein n=1 Tax=Methylorubrum salsuginis TaxID=414703 RepID=A0A1I4IS26_9HYPH|nr:hypothetical protein SAMN04488125_11826 [Methylorubrum salsuginis]